MEGTRNERVAILLIAYIIGFITAYIAFGVIQLEDSVKFPNQTASVISTQRQVVDTNVFVAIDKEGLILIKNGERTLLSITDGGALLSDGVHTSIVEYALSPDKSQVYFCELPSDDSKSCRPYIYSIVDEVVYPVTIKGERVAFEAKNHTVAWSEEGELIIE